MQYIKRLSSIVSMGIIACSVWYCFVWMILAPGLHEGPTKHMYVLSSQDGHVIMHASVHGLQGKKNSPLGGKLCVLEYAVGSLHPSGSGMSMHRQVSWIDQNGRHVSRKLKHGEVVCYSNASSSK